MNFQTTRAALATIALPVLLALPGFAADSQHDANITYWVKNALANDDRVPAVEVTVSTKDAVVTLKGTVDSLAAKNMAKKEAQKINGVIAVMDDLTVLPVWRSDIDLRAAVRRRLLSSALIDVDGLKVTSKESVVDLEGNVESYNEVLEAGLLASEVRGVKQVVNQLHVDWKGQRSDDELAQDAMAALDRDVYLSGLPIEVQAENGKLALSGTVGSSYEKQRAYNDLRWIPNVEKVDNRLVVEPWENDGARKKRPIPTTMELAHHVRAALKADPRLDASNVLVDVSNGSVALEGNVATRWERQRAEEDARSVIGVAWVTNDIFARSDLREDSAVEGDIAFSLDTDSITEGFDLEVDVNKGIAILRGDVHSWYQRSHAERVASRIRGVHDVVNEIEVKRPEWKSDTEIVKNLKDRLTWNWSTWFVHKDIHVTSVAGVVTLSGDVHSWAQRAQATEVALRTDGVLEVINRLTVQGVEYPWAETFELPNPLLGPYYEIDEYDFVLAPV